ncbi:ABC transporter substrate-binding protein [Yimella sp. cx-51]|uniref:ABC transporter substrate-binding protein n=1 Tax=Yimella sp. cx-51 TaxID=2770551 RepID=UPI00165E6D37|nr:ABC transporter substrate-binding protein [Yimella sp. cx-51]MBC9956132.1 ABC transporter substrate-binding protein [Yimella sp. cx-51]QTH37340.1 ABC transporter substrate-binding protein [Yimella sp. cx-51]
MASVHLRRRVALTTALALSFGLTACGSDSLDTGSSSSSGGSATESSKSVSADQKLADMVPAAIKSKGTITIGTDASYAPNEFLADDGKTIQGLDVDLVNAVLAKLGLKANWQNASFGTIQNNVQSGKYDMGVSSFTINKERLGAVTMVSYFSAGTLWATKKGNPDKVNPAEPCGLTVGVQKDTVQVDDLTTRSKKCTDAGKKAITQVVEQDQSKVTANLISGKVQAMASDSPIALYAVQQTGDKLETVGDVYDSAPYGLVLKKDQTDFGKALAEALKSIKSDGTYDSVLKKWNNTSGAVSTFEVNPSVGG